MSEKTSVYIASGYRLLRSMFCSFLSGKGGMVVLGEAADGETACQDIIRMKPKLVLLDIDLPGLSGLALTGRILAELPSTRVIAVTEQPEAAWLIEFLQLGGMGYLHNCCEETTILTAIQKVMAGNIYLEDAGTQLLVDHLCKNKRPPASVPVNDAVPPEALSERERQVLHLYARGYSSAGIASILFLSVSTVGTYIRRIRDKIHLESKSDLVEYTIRYELYDDWR